MSVPAIALYASPPGTVCSTADDLNHRPPSSAQRPITGGLSCLFSSAASASASSPSLRFSDDTDLMSNSLSYSTSLKSRDHSPVSVFHAPGSCGSRSSPPSLFRGFIRNALGSCLDYDSPSFPVPNVHAEEFNFSFEDGLEEPAPYARDLLAEAQSRHGIFNEEFVVKAFYEAEKAHRGQMRVSGDPYLQHCVETAVLLARIGANTTVVAAGLLHDTLDDSIMNYDYIFQTFGAGVADLVEGVSYGDNK